MRTIEQERPWTKYYDEKYTLPTIDYPDISIYELVKRAAHRVPDVVAYEFFGRKTTYGKFIEKVDSVAACLYGCGVRKGDCVLICMPNSMLTAEFVNSKS